MPSHRDYSAFLLVLAILLPAGLSAQSPVSGTSTQFKRTTISGTIFDLETSQPIPFATVQIIGTAQATTANEAGKYRLVVSPRQTYRVKVSHIAYYSEHATVTLADTAHVQDFRLHPALIELKGIRVYDRAADPAQQIILEAIARKESILNRLHNYSFDAYTKLVVRDRKKPDTANVFLIAESQLQAFWEHPDKYKEIITARRQTKNIPAEANLVRIGEILNFNKNRIELGDHQVISPTATDALDHYNYYLLDTSMIDSQRVFVIEIEPRSDLEPLFKGTISIADSTFDVVAVDVGFTGLQTPFMANPRYCQRYAQFQGEYWLPVEIRFGADYKLTVPIPGIPTDLKFSYVASLYGYSVEQGTPKGTFGEVALEVREGADEVDSTTWTERQTVPLTEQEQYGYYRIDSIQAAPKPLGRRVLAGLAGLTFLAMTQDQFFHFNRAEGAYAGAGFGINKGVPRTQFYLRGGYAFDADYWQYGLGVTSRLADRWPLTIQADYHDQAVRRPTIMLTQPLNMTVPALFSRSDPFDYFAERGLIASATTKVVNYTRFTLGYNDFRQSSLGLNSDYSIFNRDAPLRDNPSIADGTLRAVFAAFTFDSRPIYLRKGREARIETAQYSQLTFRAEYASPGFISNDFNFTRYYASLYRRQRILNWGVTSLFGFWGQADRALPSQRYFTLEYAPLSIHSGRGFQTLGKNNFGGSYVLSISLRHEFGRKLFAASGIPGLRQIPFHFNVNGGAFWTDFRNHPYMPGDDQVRVARSAYSELGFGLSNLTPFWAPFNLALNFTWQLSAYDTNRFSLTWGFEL